MTECNYVPHFISEFGCLQRGLQLKQHGRRRRRLARRQREEERECQSPGNGGNLAHSVHSGTYGPMKARLDC